MKLLKKISRILCAVSATACLVGCAEKFSEKETKYYVVYSDILNPDGLLCGIDEDGNYTSSVKINLRDGTNVGFADGMTVIGGGRANTHMLIDGEGEYKEFYLLDEPNYTGVCAVTADGDKVISSMNGGFSDGVYLNLLVIQDISGNVDVKEIIEIYAEDIICVDGTVYIVGAMDYAGEEDGWIGKIISYDTESGEMSEREFEARKPLGEIQCLGDRLYCSAYELNGGCKEIYVIDRLTLDKVGILTFEENISGLLTSEGKLYFETGGVFCEADPSDGSVAANLYTLPEGGYIEYAAASEGRIYITTRFDVPRDDGGNDPVVGVQAECVPSDGTVTETPVRMDRSKYSFFVPVPAF